MPPFNVTHLGRAELADAWPLIRAAAPELTNADWCGFASRLIDEKGGVLGVRAADGQLHGVATYRRDEALRGGRTLRVDTILTFELQRDAPVRQALLDALGLLAQAFECTSLAIAMPSRGYADGGKKGAAWRALGLDLDSVVFTHRLEQFTAARPAG